MDLQNVENSRRGHWRIIVNLCSWILCFCLPFWKKKRLHVRLPFSSPLSPLPSPLSPLPSLFSGWSGYFEGCHFFRERFLDASETEGEFILLIKLMWFGMIMITYSTYTYWLSLQVSASSYSVMYLFGLKKQHKSLHVNTTVIHPTTAIHILYRPHRPLSS